MGNQLSSSSFWRCGARISEFSGRPLFAIWDVDFSQEVELNYTEAKSLLIHLQEYLDKYDPENTETQTQNSNEQQLTTNHGISKHSKH